MLRHRAHSFTPLPTSRDDARLRRLVEELPVGVLVADLVTRTVAVANARAVETFGGDVAAGSPLSSLDAVRFESLDGAPAALALEAALAGEASPDAELRVVRADGVAREVRVSLSPILGRDRQPVGAIATCQDLAGELLVRAERERMERFRDTFLGVVGHDLRFPLGVISLTASTLERDEPDETRRRALERIVRSAGRMERMIAQLLDLTRLRVGQGLPVRPGPADLGALAAGVVDQAREAAPQAELRLEVAGDAVLEGDADRLEQVLDNLVGNAVQHGTPGTPVEVRVDGSDRDAVTLSVHNGGAVPPEVLRALFEPFTSRTGKPMRAGLGLGLYISREIVAAHGGAVDVRSTPGEGTAFVVTLPRRRAPLAPAPSP